MANISSNNLTSLYGGNQDTVITTTVVPNVAGTIPSRNLTTLYSGAGAPVTATTAYGNANVERFLNVGTDGGNTVTNIIATGNITANYYFGNGSFLTGIGNSNFAANANFANFAGNVTNSAQPNITSLGTLSNLTSIGNVNLTGAGNVSLGDVGNVHIDGGTANYVLTTDGAGNLSWEPGSTALGNKIEYGTSNVDIASANSNVTISVDGNSNILVVTNTHAIASNLKITSNSFALGGNAGGNTQGVNSIALGRLAGNTQGDYGIAIGDAAGLRQGDNTISIGRETARGGIITNTSSGTNTIAIGTYAGHYSIGNDIIAIGQRAKFGSLGGGNQSIGIGSHAGFSGSNSNTIAIGPYAGYSNIGANSIAIGANAGYTNLGNNSIVLNATGANLDQTTANTFTVKPVRQANTSNVMYYDNTTGEITYDLAIAPGNVANANYANFAGNLINGNSNVNTNGSGGNISISVGGVSNVATFQNNSINLNYAINTPDTIYIGNGAGNRSYTTGNLIAIGTNAAFGSSSNDNNSIAIGQQAGAQNGPGTDSVLLGNSAGRQGGGNLNVIIGSEAGTVSTAANVVVIGGGITTGYWPGDGSVSVGQGAGGTLINQPRAVSVGQDAQALSNSIAIGYSAFANANNSIVLNATGATLAQTTANTFTVKPVRNANTANVMFYNNTTGEITYDLASNTAVANANYANFAGTAYSVSGSNVVGEVANANYASYANIANVANSVNVANVVGIGNIATLNLDGSSSNVLYGNGVFAPESTSIANANYANFAGNLINGTSNITIPTANGNILISTAGNANIVDIRADGIFNLKPPAQGPLNAIRIDTYGRSGNVGAQRINSTRYRGNATAPLSVQPNDNTMELLTVGYNGSIIQTSSIARIQSIVDSSYTANGANIPLGWQLQVNDTNGGVNNQVKTHNFYANGNVQFANSVFATDNFTAGGNITSNAGTFFGNGAGLTNLPAGNVTGNFTYLNVIDSANVTGTIQQLAPNTITITTNSTTNTAYDLTTIYGETSNIVESGQRAIIRSRGNVSTPATVVSGDIGTRDRVYFYNGTTNAIGFSTSVVLSNLNSNSNAYSTGASYNISVGAPSGDQGNANASSGFNLLQLNQNGQLVLLPGSTSTAGTGLQMYGYGQNTNLAQAQGITMSKARGNRDANLSVQANDTVGRVLFQPHNGTSFVTNRLAIIRASVDSTYTANSANVPVGITMVVCDNTTSYNHQFYANGTYTAPGAVTIPSGNLTMGPSQTIEVNRINQTSSGAIAVYGPTTFNQGISSEGATFTGNSDVTITGSSNGTPKNFYIGDFTNGNLNMSINGNLSQSKGNVFLSTGNIFIYNGGNSLTMQGVADVANGKYANLNFDGYATIGQNMSVGGNLSVSGTLNINDLSSNNFTVGSYANANSFTANLWAETSVRGNVSLSGYNFFSNTYSPLKMQFGYGNVSLQILDGNIQVSNANGNGGYISTVNLIASDVINVGSGNALIYANGQANVANIQISSNGFTKLSTYTISALTAITGSVGWMASVTNSTPGGMLAYWDTTNSRWSYVHDNSAV